MIDTHKEGSKSPKKQNEMTDDTRMEIDVANPLRILSAYLTTAATKSPPYA